jgi:hypothetical protein
VTCCKQAPRDFLDALVCVQIFFRCTGLQIDIPTIAAGKIVHIKKMGYIENYNNTLRR